MTTAAVSAASKQQFWLRLLACPNCHAELTRVDDCVACGISFKRDEHVPVLMSTRCQRTVQYEFQQSRSVADTALARVLQDPPGYEARDLPYHLDPAHALIARHLPSGSTVLEIGCGGGQCRQWFTQQGHHYVGTDISRERVSESLKQYGGPDVLADAHFLPFRDRSFDMVYAAAVTEHLACPTLMAQEVKRVLKPGGYFCSNVSFLEPWHDSSFYHMSPLGVYELLIANGLDVRYIWPGAKWGAFRAIASMAFGGPFRSLRWIGRGGDAVYAAQVALQRWRRRSRGIAADELAMKARIAGAIAWIAVRSPSVDRTVEVKGVVTASSH